MLLLLYLLLLYLALRALYRVLGLERTRYRVAAKVWIRCFILESVLSLGITPKTAERWDIAPEQVWSLPIALLFHPLGVMRAVLTGHGNVYLVLFLLPLVAAVVAYYLYQREVNNDFLPRPPK